MAQPAFSEDFDDDKNTVKPNTRLDATKRPASYSKLVAQHANGRTAASDSGYSSRASATSATASPGQGYMAVAPVPRQSAPSSPTQKKPVARMREASQSRPSVPSRSPSVSKSPCADINCSHTACMVARNPERRYTMWEQQVPLRPQHQWAQHTGQTQQYMAQPSQYQPVPPPQQMPAPTTTARPRATSASKPYVARPQSYHAGMVPGYSVPQNYAGVPAQHGPPPSPSAYQNLPYGSFGQQYGQYHPQGCYIGTTPPNTTFPGYPQPSVPQYTPPSPQYRADQPTISARQPTAPPLAGYDHYHHQRSFKPSANRASSTNPVSARYPDMPGTFPMEAESSGYSSGSESYISSSSESSGDGRRRQTRRPRGRHDSREMPPPILKVPTRRMSRNEHNLHDSRPRRPSFNTRQTDPVVFQPTRSRERLPRAPHSDHGRNKDHHPSSDRGHRPTTRPIVKQHSSHHSSISRQPSVSTNASGRTGATTLSSCSGSGLSKVVIENADGQVDKEHIRRLQQTQKLEEVEAYQTSSRGGATNATRTAESMAHSQAQNLRRSSDSKSHASAHSRKSGHSRKSSSTNNGGGGEGIQIRSGDTTLYIHGEANIQFRAGEDGGPPQLVIGGSSGRERSYHGSKSSGSRVGRSRHGSDLGRAVQEEGRV
ncbi:hypothetical protein MBLNU230_g6974t1 [Neophaeotheca triangularis]